MRTTKLVKCHGGFERRRFQAVCTWQLWLAQALVISFLLNSACATLPEEPIERANALWRSVETNTQARAGQGAAALPG